MDKESILQDLGKCEDRQWYEIFPERLREEVILVKKYWPDFVFSGTEHKGNVYWTGKALCLCDGKELYSLQIRIECPRDYPIVFPKVYDIEGILLSKNCPHLNEKDKSICYGNRLDSELDFIKNTRIKDLIYYVSVFLARQWYFEKNGEWPDGQLHGSETFIEYEKEHDPIPLFEWCPCGMTKRNYKDCHFQEVNKLKNKKFLEELMSSPEAKRAVRQQLPKNVGRNDKCPCGSGRKYKNCCLVISNIL